MPRVQVRSFFREVVNFCYPGRCAVCEAAYEGASPLCVECDAALRKAAEEPNCDFCAMPLPVHGSPCPYCEGGGVAHYERIIRLGSFHDPLKHLIHHIKYHGRWPLAEFLADRLMEQERVKAILQEGGVLLPVPLHPLRQIARGFNQADVVARHLHKRDKRLRVVNPVLRLRHTETQTHLHSRAQRRENLRDAFGLIRPSAVRGRHVIVVDDVRTTGATLHALARALRPAKPASLCAIVLAVADPKGKDFEAV
jgi:ComF family protein